jgi:hypothetical protein
MPKMNIIQLLERLRISVISLVFIGSISSAVGFLILQGLTSPWSFTSILFSLFAAYVLINTINQFLRRAKIVRALGAISELPECLGEGDTILGLGPYSDTIVSFLYPYLAKAEGKTSVWESTELNLITRLYGWRELIDAFWSMRCRACMHNHTLLASVNSEQILIFVPLYIFRGNFVLVSKKYLDSLDMAKHIVIQVDPPLLRIEEGLSRATYSRILTSVERGKGCYIRDVDHQEFLDLAMNLGLTAEEVAELLSKFTTELKPDFHIASVGADEAFYFMRSGKYAALASSLDRDREYMSVDGLFVRLADWESYPWPKIAQEYITAANAIKISAIQYLDGDSSSEGLFSAYANRLSSERDRYSTDPASIAAALNYCFAPIPQTFHPLLRQRWIKEATHLLVKQSIDFETPKQRDNLFYVKVHVTPPRAPEASSRNMRASDIEDTRYSRED